MYDFFSKNYFREKCSHFPTFLSGNDETDGSLVARSQLILRSIIDDHLSDVGPNIVGIS